MSAVHVSTVIEALLRSADAAAARAALSVADAPTAASVSVLLHTTPSGTPATIDPAYIPAPDQETLLSSLSSTAHPTKIDPALILDKTSSQLIAAIGDVGGVISRDLVQPPLPSGLISAMASSDLITKIGDDGAGHIARAFVQPPTSTDLTTILGAAYTTPSVVAATVSGAIAGAGYEATIGHPAAPVGLPTVSGAAILMRGTGTGGWEWLSPAGSVTSVDITGTYTISEPAAAPVGTVVKYYVKNTSSAGQALAFASAIKGTPGSISLSAGVTHIVHLEYAGAFWALVRSVGPLS